jgi:hypothetical protein
MQIIWKIGQLERQPNDGLVTCAHWTATATDGDISAHAYGTATFTRAEDFTPFEQLTQDTVVNWVKAKVDANAIEKSLKDQIDAQKNPPVLTGVPWAAE